MSDRNERLKYMIQLIQEERIGSQDELLNAVTKRGFSCTQATLSRNLKKLHAVKYTNDAGESYYVLPDSFDYPVQSHSGASGFLYIKFTESMAVIKTQVSYSHTLALRIDRANCRSVLGTIAGDDTIFVALQAGVHPEVVIDELHQVIPEISR